MQRGITISTELDIEAELQELAAKRQRQRDTRKALRQEHARRRRYGLQQRHTQKLRRENDSESPRG